MYNIHVIIFQALLFLVSREHVFMLFPAQSCEHTVYAQVLFSRVCRSRGLYVGLCIFRVVKLEAQEVALSLHVVCLLVFVCVVCISGGSKIDGS